jgi:L-threonylcarbamoyladenylate synthase
MMETKIIVWRSAADDHVLKEAADALKRGELVAFPTETVYGLGADALNPVACKAIYEAKERPGDNPLIVHVDTPSAISTYTDIPNLSLFTHLAHAFMPGPLTVILPKKTVISDEVTAGLGTVAMRCPSNGAAHALLRMAGIPVAAPSANTSGRPSPTTAQHVIDDLFGKIPYIIDGGNCQVGLESTIVLPHESENSVTLLRPGGITVEDLYTVCEKVYLDQALQGRLQSDAQPLAPGMKYRHYAPKSPMTGVVGEDRNVRSFFTQKLKNGFGVLCFDEDVPFLPESDKLITLGGKREYDKQAQDLFACLRRFDVMDVSAIYTRVPEDDSLGLAVKNRLLKACAFTVLAV